MQFKIVSNESNTDTSHEKRTSSNRDTKKYINCALVCRTIYIYILCNTPQYIPVDRVATSLKNQCDYYRSSIVRPNETNASFFSCFKKFSEEFQLLTTGLRIF